VLFPLADNEQKQKEILLQYQKTKHAQLIYQQFYHHLLNDKGSAQNFVFVQDQLDHEYKRIFCHVLDPI